MDVSVCKNFKVNGSILQSEVEIMNLINYQNLYLGGKFASFCAKNSSTYWRNNPSNRLPKSDY